MVENITTINQDYQLTNLPLKSQYDDNMITNLIKELNEYKKENQQLKEQIVNLKQECKNKDQITQKLCQIQSESSDTINKLDPQDINKKLEFNNFQFHIKKLHFLILKERMLRDTVTKTKNDILNQIQTIIQEIIVNKIKITEQFDNIEQRNESIIYNYNNKISEVYRDNSIFIENVLKYLKQNVDFVYKILINCNSEQERKCMSHFFANFFYLNISSSGTIENDFLVLIYKLLNNEISHILCANESEQFLSSNSICSYLFKYFIRNNDVAVYFGKLLSTIVEGLETKLQMSNLKFNPIELKQAVILDQQCKNKTLKKKKINGKNLNENSDTPKEVEQPILVLITDSFYTFYCSDLLKKELLSIIDKADNEQIKVYLTKQLNEIQKYNDDNIFINQQLLSHFYSIENPEVLEEFEKGCLIVIEIINYVFKYLNDNISTIHVPLRYISKMISMLIKSKFPQINNIEVNAFISEFLFKQVIIPIFSSSEIICLLLSKEVSLNIMKSINQIVFIISKLIRGYFFNALNDPNYTIFNRYFIEIMPSVITFFNKLIDIELPYLIQKCINQESIQNDFIEHDNNLGNISTNNLDKQIHDYYRTTIQYNILCFSPEHIITILDIIKRNANLFNEPKVVDEALQNAYKLFVRSYTKLTQEQRFAHLREIQDKYVQSELKIYKYVSLNEINLCDQLQKILNVNKDYFLFNEIKNSENNQNKNQNLLTQIKYALSAILFNISHFTEINGFLEKSTSFETFLGNLMLLKTKHVLLSSQPFQIEYHISLLRSLSTRIPEIYKEANYEKLLIELENNLQESINNIELGLLTKMQLFYNTIIKERQLTTNKEIKLNKFSIIQKYLHNVSFNAELLIRIEDNAQKITFHFGTLKAFNQFALDYDDNDLNMVEIKTVTEFIEKFPVLSKYKGKVFEIQISNKIPKLINQFVNGLQDYMSQNLNNNKDFPEQSDKKRKQSVKIKKEQITNKNTNLNDKIDNTIQIIQDYVLMNLYHKLFPLKAEKEDDEIYHKCLQLSWIKFNHVGLLVNVDYFVSFAINLMKQFHLAKLPEQKMEILSKLIKNILITLNLHLGKIDGSIDDVLPFLVFVIIKSKPKFLSSNINFIQLYHKQPKLIEVNSDFVFLKLVKDHIRNLSYINLKNVTEEEFSENCRKTIEHYKELLQ